MSAAQKRSGPKTAPELTQPHRNQATVSPALAHGHKPITFSVFGSLSAKTCEEAVVEWCDLPAFLVDDPERKANHKTALRLFVAGTFDGSKTAKGAVRHDAGMLSMTAVVIDYDEGRLAMEAGAAIFEQHGCPAVLAPTASWSEGFSKWRAVIPLSRTYSREAGDDLKALHRQWVATVRAWGIPASGETDTLSQSYYFGTPAGKAAPDPITVSGLYPIDRAEQTAPRADPGLGQAKHVEPDEMARLLEVVSTGAMGVHEAMRRLSMAWINRGLDAGSVKAMLGLALDKWGRPDDARWAERRGEVDRLVDGAARRLLADKLNVGDDPYSDIVAVRGSDVQQVPIDWLWPGFLAKGKLHILAGKAGGGKTTIALGLLATITAGGVWPDGFDAPQGNVIVWSSEDDVDDTLAPRLSAAGADMSRVYFLTAAKAEDGKTRPFDPATDLAKVEGLAKQVGSVAAILLDPVVNAVAGDSHKNSEVRRGLQPVLNLALALRCTVIGISHFTKGSAGQDPLERVTGSLAFGAVARVVFAAAKARDVEGNERRVFVRAKSNIGPDGGGFVYELKNKAIRPDLEASYVEWGDELMGEAKALLLDREAEGETPAGAVVETFLRDRLKDGPVASKALRDEIEGTGLASWKTALRVSTAIGVVKRKAGMGGGWTWALPTLATTNPPDAEERPRG